MTPPPPTVDGGSPRAQDPRPARTRTAILEAITRLGAAGRPLSVAAIAHEAGISRSSFYARFTDLDDVAVQLVSELFRRVRTIDTDLRGSGPQREATRATLGAIVDDFSARRSLYAAVLGAQISGPAQRRIQVIFAEGARATMDRMAPPGVDRDLAAQFVAAGVLGTLTDWLLAEAPSTPDDVLTHMLAMLPPWLVDGPATPAGAPAHTPSGDTGPPQEHDTRSNP